MSYNNHQYNQNTPNVNNFKDEQRPPGPPPEQRSNIFNPYSAPPQQQQQQNYDYGSNYRQSQLPPQQQYQQGNNRGPPTAASLVENAKYKFLPYGQPISPAPQQQAYSGYNNQYQFYPPQGQGSVGPFVNQNVQNQSFNYSGYSQGQNHQEQPVGGGGSGYFREQYAMPNTQFPPPTPMPVPLPVPLPVPAPLPVPPPSIPSIQPKSTTTSGYSGSAEMNKDKEPPSSSSSSSSNSSSRKSEKKKEKKELKKEEHEWPKQNEPVSEPKETKTKKPVPIMIGKRRGGKTRNLPTGVVKKQRAESPEEGKRTDAWSQYMNEVKRYKDRSCEDDRKNRPLVK